MPGCLDDSELERFCAGEMTEQEAARAQTHIRECPECAGRHAALGKAEDRVLGELRGLGRDGAAELRGRRSELNNAGGPGEPAATQSAARNPSDATEDRPVPVAHRADESASPSPGFSVPGYQFVRELHRGGQGIVYQAIQEATRRTVAIKVLLEGVLASSSSKKRFDREVHLLSQLAHPNIVTIFDSGVASNGCRYYVMEHIPGRTINEHVRSRNLSVREVLRLFVAVSRGVHFAHQRGVVHRDLKPSNVLIETVHVGATAALDDLGTPRILDFGLGKLLTGAEETIVSLTGQVFGTLPYMSPEQVGGRPEDIDARADVYALGVILYELLTGRYPYPMDGQIGDAIQHIRETEPTPPSRAWTAEHGIRSAGGDRKRISDQRKAWAALRRRVPTCPIDEEVQSIILQCLSKDRRARYQSAAELADDVERYLDGAPVRARRRSTFYLVRKAIPRHKLSLALAAVVIVAGIGTTVAIQLRDRLREQRVRQRADMLDRMQQALLLMNADLLDDLTGSWKEEDFGEAEYETYRGWLHMLHLDAEPAMEHADRAVALAPEDPIAHYLRACIRAYRYDGPGAAVDFSVAQKYAGDGFLELGLRGMLKGLLQQYESSIEDLDLLVERHRGSAAALWVRGCSRWFHVLRDPPPDLDARWRLGTESREDMSAAIKIYPTIPFVFDARADLLRRLCAVARARGDERAAADLLQARRDDAERIIRLGAVGNGHAVLSTLAFDEGDLEEALRQADRAYELLTTSTAVAAINRDDALRNMISMRIWAGWALGDDAAAREQALQLAREHPQWSASFVFGFVEAISTRESGATSPRTGDAAASREKLHADKTDLGSPGRSYGLGLWSGAKYLGDGELARHIAKRFSVGLVERLRWEGALLRFLQGDSSEQALLRAAGEEVERLQIARLVLAMSSPTAVKRDRQFQQLFALAHPSPTHFWARGIDVRVRREGKRGQSDGE